MPEIFEEVEESNVSVKIELSRPSIVLAKVHVAEWC